MTEPDVLDVSTLTLPPHIHVQIEQATDIVTGLPLVAAVVWADRVESECDQCHQPIAQDPGCPATLNPGAGQGGQVEEWSQQHGCGNWLTVRWTEAQPAEESILATAQNLAAARAAEIEQATIALHADLASDLEAALARLAEPLEDGETAEDRRTEVTTGSEVDPGVFILDGQWVAWAYEPDGGEGDCITVTAAGAAEVGE